MIRSNGLWTYNASAESFTKKLKCEQVYLSEYDSLADANVQIGHFLEAVYNQKRLHSSLGCLPPADYEQLYQKDRDKNQAIIPWLFDLSKEFSPVCYALLCA